jgi:hypothetical protein
MPSDKKNNVGHHLVDFLTDPDGVTEAELNEQLEKLNVDVHSLVDRVKDIVNQALDEDRLAWQGAAKADRTAVLNSLKGIKSKLLNLPRAELLERLKEIKNSAGPGLSIAFREADPDKMDDDDIRDMIVNLIHLENLQSDNDLEQ